MKVYARYIVLLPAVLLLAELFGFQNPSTLDGAAKLLESQDFGERAWGAYLAGESGLSELQPKLESILEEAGGISDQCFVRSVLDAEIRMRADLPTKVLAEIYERYPNETTILLAQSPHNHLDMILSLFQSQRVSARWLALGNLLLQAKAPGFPLVLMQDMKQMHIDVSIHDPNDGRGGIGGGWGEGVGAFNVPIGYPPVTLYDFSDRSTHDATVVANGPHTVYATKVVIHPGERAQHSNGGGFVSDYWESNAYRLEYLSSMLDLPKDDVQFNKHFTMVWNGPVQFVQDLTLLCERILEKYDRILALLRDAGLISPSAAETLEGSIFVTLTDFRRNKATRLPEISLKRVIVSNQ